MMNSKLMIWKIIYDFMWSTSGGKLSKSQLIIPAIFFQHVIIESCKINFNIHTCIRQINEFFFKNP